ncbi:hypothetical protein GGH93_003322 [Coemansia aciculifera]|nr:hypothetical protein GGH93_003322 [Coemansia aciculifera]
MIFQSLFQTLPILVVEKIIEYLVGHPRSSFDDDIRRHSEMKVVLYPLLSVSEIWCEAALVSICDSCEVVFNDARGIFDENYPAWPKGVSYSGFRRERLVKRVVVTAPGWRDICYQTSREANAWSQYEGAIFPSATNLVVKLNKSNYDPSLMDKRAILPTPRPDTVGWCKGVVDFARALLRMTPAVTGLSVVAISVDATHKSHRGLCAILVSVLRHGGVTRLDVRCKTGSLTGSLRPHIMTGLTSIAHGVNISCSPIAWLAYHNAPTLKELHIAPTGLDDWSSLMTCGKQAPASYTNLVSLYIDIANTSAQGWTTVEGAIPFPVLSQLDISGAYPFADNTLFRGNREMLQRLSIPFDAIAKNVLRRSGVSERSDVRRFSPINTVLITGTPHHMPSDNLIPEQLHCILETSKTLKLGYDPFYGQLFNRRVFDALYTAPSTAILQHLTLFGLNCAIGDIISVVSALPSLVSLTSQIHGSATRIGLIPENEHPSTLYEKYYPLSKNFRVLHVPSVANADIGRVSIVAMQLSVVCPNFAYVDLPLELRKGFKGKATWSSRNGPFKPYGDALRRLI